MSSNSNFLDEFLINADQTVANPYALSDDKAKEIAKLITSFWDESERLRQLLPPELKHVTTEHLKKAAFEALFKCEVNDLPLHPPKLIRQKANDFVPADLMKPKRAYKKKERKEEETELKHKTGNQLFTCTVADCQIPPCDSHNFIGCQIPDCAKCLKPGGDWELSVKKSLYQ